MSVWGGEHTLHLRLDAERVLLLQLTVKPRLQGAFGDAMLQELLAVVHRWLSVALASRDGYEEDIHVVKWTPFFA